MPWLRSRATRVNYFGRLVAGLVVGGVTLATAIGFWFKFLGWAGIIVVVILILGLLLGVLALPERVWRRVTADPRATARAVAIKALTDQLVEARRLRHIFFEKLPMAAAIKTAVDQWFVDTVAVVEATAPEFIADMTVSRSVREGSAFKNDQGVDLSSDQSGQVARLDIEIDKLLEILSKVRDR